MKNDNEEVKIQGQCHCGAVGFEISQSPEWLTACNCTLCRRLAALWAHIEKGTFTRLGDGETISYVQGDKTLAAHICSVCGCTTHWEGLLPDNEVMAVNFRMCEPDVVSRYRVRQFDGADTWKFID
jgi:hypothetical protein